jgi:hypothetical protein
MFSRLEITTGLPGLGRETRESVPDMYVANLFAQRTRPSIAAKRLRETTSHSMEGSAGIFSVVSLIERWNWIFGGPAAMPKEIQPTTPSRQRLSASSGVAKRFPYPALIKALIELDEIGAARTLVATAIHDEEVDPNVLQLEKLLALPLPVRLAELDVERTPEYQWLQARGSEHRGFWVALIEGNLVARSSSLKDLREKLKQVQLSRQPLIHRIE